VGVAREQNGDKYANNKYCMFLENLKLVLSGLGNARCGLVEFYIQDNIQ